MNIPKDKLDIDKINSSVQHIKNIIIATVSYFNVQGVRYVYWPLFICNERECQTDQIDTCATSLGLLILLKANGDNVDQRTNSLVEKALETIIWLRNEDGSWPSVKPIHNNNPPQMEGVINDTVYALTALIEAGFLAHSPKVSVKNLKTKGSNPQTLDSIESRVDLILESVEWLFNNRVIGGWDYTGIDYLEHTASVFPALLPTVNTTILFSQLIKAIKSNCPSKFDHRLETAYEESIKWIKEHQGNSGGFGKKRGDKPRLVHTCVAISALLTADTEENKNAALKAFRWIINNKKSCNSELMENDDYFDQYDQIIFSGDRIFKRVINNETFLEGIMLNCLINMTNNESNKLKTREKYKIRKIIEYHFNTILKRQEKHGDYQGAIKSRRGVPNEQHPVYCLYHALLGLLSLRDSLNIIKALPSFSFIIIRNTIIFLVFVVLIVLMMKYQHQSMGSAAILIITGLIINIVTSILQK